MCHMSFFLLHRMASKLVSILLVALCFASPSLADDVLELVDSDFDSTLESVDTALVMFYAPWCGHCKRLKPEFEKAAQLLKSNDPPVALAKVDCTEGGKDSCGRFDVRGYPTLKIFRGGELSSDYNGPREVNGIVKYMKAQVGDASKEFTNAKDLTTYLDAKDEVVVFAVGSDLATFQKVADALRETVAFAHIKADSADDISAGIYLNRPKHLATKMEDARVTFGGDASSKDAIKTWINENYHGLVGHRTMDNQRDFKSPLLTAYYSVDYVKNVKGTNYWRNRVMKVAKELKEETGLNFAVSNIDDFMQEVTEYGLAGVGQDKPQVAINADGKKYVMSEEFSVDSLRAFIKDFKAGKIEAYLKSEDIPASNDGPVKVAVAKNFDELVTKSEKDVLIEFYVSSKPDLPFG